jgi:Xaa-Pro aminopeptidase
MYLLTDWTRRVDFDAMRAWRRTRLLDSIEKHGLDGVLCFRSENIRYMTGLRLIWWPITRLQSTAMMSADSGAEPLVYVNGGDWPHRRETMYWMDPDRVRPQPAPLEDAEHDEKTLRALAPGVEELGLDKGRIGIDLTYVHLLDALQERFPNAEFVDGDACLQEARLVKGPDEIALMRAASRCVDLGFATAREKLRPGIRECTLLGEIMRTYYDSGMETWQCSSIVSSGDQLYPLARFASDREVQDGDIVFIDVGGCFNGMFAESTRTIPCGEPNDKHCEIYRAVYDVMMATKDAIRPGASNVEVFEKADRVYRNAGFGDDVPLMILGHSIGVAGWETATIGPDDLIGREFTLEPGMIFSVEPTVAIPGVPGGGCVRLEDEILCTEDGSEFLTTNPYETAMLERTAGG